jgi:hypothetical protein
MTGDASLYALMSPMEPDPNGVHRPTRVTIRRTSDERTVAVVELTDDGNVLVTVAADAKMAQDVTVRTSWPVDKAGGRA